MNLQPWLNGAANDQIEAVIRQCKTELEHRRMLASSFQGCVMQSQTVIDAYEEWRRLVAKEAECE